MYNRAGFIAEASPVSFVGTISYLGGPLDTTLVQQLPAEADQFRVTGGALGILGLFVAVAIVVRPRHSTGSEERSHRDGSGTDPHAAQ